jgi:uncharacterized protein (TIGR02270 family)
MADAATRPAGILWDVQEEHLSETAFCLNVRERALLAWNRDLEALTQDLDERMVAHADALLVGGKPVMDELVRPVVEDPEQVDGPLVTAAALTMTMGDRALFESVLAAFATAAGKRSLAIGRALELTERLDANLRLAAYFDAAKPEAKLPWIRVLAARGHDFGRALHGMLSDKDPAMRAAGATAAINSDRAALLRGIEVLLDDPEPAVADAALHTGLVWGSPLAWSKLKKRALESKDPIQRTHAVALVCALGEPNIAAGIATWLPDAERRPMALWGLGFCGRIEAADACLAWLGDKATCQLAGEAFAAITGLPLEDDRYWLRPEPEPPSELPPLEQDDLDADLTDDPAADLPIPNPEAIAKWWAEIRPRLDGRSRQMLGRAMTGESLIVGLRELTLRRREVTATELAVRSRGAARLDTRAFGRVQRARIDALVPIAMRVEVNRGFERIA